MAKPRGKLTAEEQQLLKSKQQLLKDIISMEDRGLKTAFDKKEVEEEIEQLLAKQNTKLSEQLKIQRSSIKAADDYDKALKSQDKSISGILGSLLKGNVAAAAETALAQKSLGVTVERAKQNKEIQESLKDQKDFSKLDGENKIKVLELINGINSGLYNQVSVQATLEDIGEDKLKTDSKLVEIIKSFAESADEEKTAKEKASEAQAIFNKNLGRGAFVFAALLAVAQKFASSVDAIGKQFGSLNVLSDEFKGNLMDAEMEVTGIGATMEDVVATTSALAGEFGISATDAADLSAQVIDTAKAVGLSNEEAAKLSGILQTTSGLSAEQAEQLTEGAFQLAVANDVAPDAVMKDLASSAEEFALFSKDGGDNLARAAVQSKAMGLSLADTAKTAEGLLNFQDSITKEVEASVLIGRQLNLQKAREAALADDLVGMNEAIVEQLGSQEEFNKLNSIQRKAIADALGKSVADLSKMITNQEKANDLAGETAKSFEDIIGKEAMSELTATMNELKVFGVAIANTLGPLLMGAARLVNMLLVPLGNMVVGISSAFRGSFGGASMDDGVVGPGGISMMAGSAGVFKLNPRDSVMATTNPIPVNDIRTGPPGSMGGGTNVQISSKMVKLGGGDLGLAIDAYTYPSNTGQGRTAYDAVTGRV
tara:strand:+ start:244 stop:2205 length:1962 start_codon:yes stop_codon:yes gene_type:complete